MPSNVVLTSSQVQPQTTPPGSQSSARPRDLSSLVGVTNTELGRFLHTRLNFTVCLLGVSGWGYICGQAQSFVTSQ